MVSISCLLTSMCPFQQNFKKHVKKVFFKIQGTAKKDIICKMMCEKSPLTISIRLRSIEAKIQESVVSLSTRSLTSCKQVKDFSLDQNKGCFSTADVVGLNEGSPRIIFSEKIKKLNKMQSKIKKKVSAKISLIFQPITRQLCSLQQGTQQICPVIG